MVAGYHDALGQWREASEGALREVLGSMGVDPDVDGVEPPSGGPLIVRPGLVELPAGELLLEDGTQLEVGWDGAVVELPLGYHRLQRNGEQSRLVVVSPGSCPSPHPVRQWGWAAQLYAARSSRSWGIGDLGDLATWGEWATSHGAGLLLINPLHAAAPVGHQEPSPYFAGSRCFLNPLYLRIENLTGADALRDLALLAAQGRALNEDRIIDRDRVWALKSAALEALFEGFDTPDRSDPAFDQYRAERGDALEGFATWNALAELHGVPWQAWPAEFRHPRSPGVVAFAASPHGARRIRYHAWLQWHLDRQLAAAADRVGVVGDLAIGVNAGGPDAWVWQDQLAFGMHVGAPPDEFNTLGQDWGLPPWNPHKVSACGYEPFIETIRGCLRHAAGLRVDHVMGLFRLFWIPEERSAAEGIYVRYPHQDLLDIMALEATRAGAYVVGEDLGTIEPWVHDALRAAGTLSYRLWWFEPGRPESWPHQALGAVSTHDLPTVAGAWTGSDLAAQERLDLHPNRDGAAAMRHRLAEWTGSDDTTPIAQVVERTYEALSAAPCALLTVSLDDVCEVEERPNFPGTTDQWPNWCLALPEPLEDIIKRPATEVVARHLSARDGLRAAGTP